MKKLTGLLIMTMAIIACKKEDCQRCTKTIGGVTGNIVDEVRDVCNESEALELEKSSYGTTVWKCE